MAAEITPRQAVIIGAWRRWVAMHHAGPSFDDLAAEAHVSHTTARREVAELHRLAYFDRPPGRRGRSRLVRAEDGSRIEIMWVERGPQATP